MGYFDQYADKNNIGNMKGLLEKDVPDDAVVLFGAEADFPTAPVIREKLKAFADNGSYGFTLADEQYLNAIQYWMKEVRKTEIQKEWVVPVNGTVFALSTAIRAFTDVSEGIIMQTPSYYRFDRAVIRNQRTAVYNPLMEENGVYQIDFDDLEQKCADPSNKMLVLVNPHNPTGKVFSKRDLEKITAVAQKYNVLVFCDEIFAETAQPGFPTSLYASFNPRSLTCTSLGKSFSLTGFNQANVLIPDGSLREKYIVQRDIDHFGSIDPFFYQALTTGYTPEGKEWIRQMNAYVFENYSLIKSYMKQKMPLFSLSPLEGTFILWIDCRKLNLTEEELQSFFENDAGIYADPGNEYGEAGKGFYRWCIAVPRKKIEKALLRLYRAYTQKWGV